MRVGQTVVYYEGAVNSENVEEIAAIVARVNTKDETLADIGTRDGRERKIERKAGTVDLVLFRPWHGDAPNAYQNCLANIVPFTQIKGARPKQVRGRCSSID